MHPAASINILSPCFVILPVVFPECFQANSRHIILFINNAVYIVIRERLLKHKHSGIVISKKIIIHSLSSNTQFDYLIDVAPVHTLHLAYRPLKSLYNSLPCYGLMSVSPKFLCEGQTPM